jgi:osmotically-inducible protein OsmY
MKNAILNYIALILLLFPSACSVCLVGAAGGAGYVAGEAASDKERGVVDVLSDSAVTANVNAAFAANKKLSMWDINVDTHLGEVTLRGYVKSEAIIEEAVNTAKKVKGVKKVITLLVVDKETK